MDAEILFDMGAYTRTHGGFCHPASAMLGGPLRIKNILHVFLCLTNKTPSALPESGALRSHFVRDAPGYGSASPQSRPRRHPKA